MGALVQATWVHIPALHLLYLGKLLNSQCLILLICKIDMILRATHLKVFWRYE